MAKTMDAVYAQGILRPLEPLDLQESQPPQLTLEVLPRVVEETQALIRARAEGVNDVADLRMPHP
jgi:predicted DNA-binding antitoxin AbrB/MazE fold protein